jgi:hypothetical protein
VVIVVDAAVGAGVAGAAVVEEVEGEVVVVVAEIAIEMNGSPSQSLDAS